MVRMKVDNRLDNNQKLEEPDTARSRGGQPGPEGGAQRQETDGEEKRPLYKEILSYVKIIVIACIAGLLMNHFVLINAVIPSESMEKLLMVGDRVFGCRLSYVLKGPERFDVVMFKYPVDEETIYIKRVIGLPGETVEIKKGKIYIDKAAEPLEEIYLPEKWVSRNDGYRFEVPEDCYFMMGDNRNLSEDGRDWAECAIDDGVASSEEEAMSYSFVQKEKIIGRTIMKYYPEIDIFLNIGLK